MNHPFSRLKIAVVHDWLPLYGGAERILEQVLVVLPNADIFSIIDGLDPNQRGFIQGKPVNTSFIQRLPRGRTKYRFYLALMPLAIEQFDLSSYDVIISNSYAVAKGVITGPDQLHLCICCSPIRYAWDLQHQYLQRGDLHRGVKSWIARLVLHYVRMWDVRTANGVDQFAAISNFVARRILKAYRRDSITLYPPVDVARFSVVAEKEDFYLAASRMVPYKRIDLIVEVFTEMQDKRLIVIGDGPEFAKIKKKAGKNVTFLGYQDSNVLRDHLQRARAFVFAAEEDFGILPVEAQACGTPVIAFGRGGAIETIIDGQTGVLFGDQTLSSLQNAIMRFERIANDLNCYTIRANAERFGIERFRDEFQKLLKTCLTEHPAPRFHLARHDAETASRHVRRRGGDLQKRGKDDSEAEDELLYGSKV